MNHPIIQRELIGLLRSPKSLAMQLFPAIALAAMVLLRWPTSGQAGVEGVQAYAVFRLFGYGLLAVLLLLTPIFPATTIVRERTSGTLALLLNSPMSSASIYFGKFAGMLGFVLLPMAMSLPAAAACYAMGGLSFGSDLGTLYGVLLLMCVEYTALGLWVSTYAGSTDSALRITFAAVLGLAVLTLAPYQFFQGSPGILGVIAEAVRTISPIPAVMEVLGHGNLASLGALAAFSPVWGFVIWAVILTVGFMVHTILRLNLTMFDRPRQSGVMTDDRERSQRWFRRFVYLIDPQRRKNLIGPLTNPVLVKEFRSRKFGRSHWMIRLVGMCAVVSLLLAYLSTTQTTRWSVEEIGGTMVLLQGALITLITPSIASGLISGEHERGGWTLLRMTPLSAGTIVRGKLISVCVTLALILLATLPGYVLMIAIQPVLAQQVVNVLLSLVLAAIFALMLSATISSFFQRTAGATLTSYAVLVVILGGTLLIWLARDAPFGHRTVELALSINPLAAAMNILNVPGFQHYALAPLTWYVVGGATVILFFILAGQTWRLTRPQ